MGVDIIQNCEVKGIKRNGDSVEGIETTKGFIKTNKVGVVAAGHSSVIANMAGLRLPLESKPLQALVSEPVKPIIDTVVSLTQYMLMSVNLTKENWSLVLEQMIMFLILKKVVIK